MKNRYEQALDQLHSAKKAMPIINKNTGSNDKNLYQFDMLNAILEKKFILCHPEGTPNRMNKFSKRSSRNQYKSWIPNGKNMKYIYNCYPIKWTDPPKPWFPFKVKYKANSNYEDLKSR